MGRKIPTFLETTLAMMNTTPAKKKRLIPALILLRLSMLGF
jgi:hypothetical protein